MKIWPKIAIGSKVHIFLIVLYLFFNDALCVKIYFFTDALVAKMHVDAILWFYDMFYLSSF